jgi:hypothetical protein
MPNNLDLGSEFDDVLPKPPTMTPEMQKTIDIEQRKMSSRFDTSPGARNLMRARAIVAESATIPIEDLSPRQKMYYADALATLGHYAQAFEISGDEIYREIAEAFTNKECKCKDSKTHVLKDEKPELVTHSRFYKKQNIYVDGVWKSLVACNQCQNLTVREQ